MPLPPSVWCYPTIVIAWLTDGHLVVVFVTFNLWEEVAWMGFFQARLQEHYGATRAAMLTGPVFALGHISQVMEGSLSTVIVTLALLIAVCIPFRALQGWVYNRTGSLVPVALVHAAANATAAGSLAGAGLLDRLYPGDGAGGLVFPVLGALGLVAIALTRRPMARPSGQGEGNAMGWSQTRRVLGYRRPRVTARRRPRSCPLVE